MSTSTFSIWINCYFVARSHFLLSTYPVPLHPLHGGTCLLVYTKLNPKPIHDTHIVLFDLIFFRWFIKVEIIATNNKTPKKIPMESASSKLPSHRRHFLGQSILAALGGSGVVDLRDPGMGHHRHRLLFQREFLDRAPLEPVYAEHLESDLPLEGL